MKNTRRLKRMARAKRNKAGGLNLTSLMDVFTILVLYLLVNQSTVQIDEPPKDVKLPDSVAEAKPRQAVVVMVSEQSVLIQGVLVIGMADLIASKASTIEPVREALLKVKENAMNVTPGDAEKNNEVIIMAHRTVPFKVLKVIMSSCTSAGYTKISLAVNQKSDQK
jgi:biopolymer transport protein ExbD